MLYSWVCLSLILSLIPHNGNGEALCPMKCACSRVKPKTQFSFGDLYKLKCGTPDARIQELAELFFHTYPNIAEVSTIDLSDNEISKIPTNALQFPNLQKLDLNKNQISVIDPGAFLNLTNLKTLILSNNKISFLSKELFEGLSSLEVLKLGQNSIVQLTEGTFVHLPAISKLDLSSNPLLCDCSLLWLHDWAYNTSVKLFPAPKCQEPPLLRGQLLSRLHTSSTARLTCDWLVPDNVHVLELQPSQNQLVFEGDSLRLQCRVVSGDALDDDTIMNWSWGGGQDPAVVFDQTVQIESKFPRDSGMRESTLIIDHITKNHSGTWNCEFISGDINHTSTISVIVISEDTQYCPSSTTTDNRGTYLWPKTVVGFTCELPCAVPPPDEDYQDEDPAHLRAARHCSPQGQWGALNSSLCPFVEANTRLLQQFSKMNLTARQSGGDALVTTATRLLTLLSSEAPTLRDPLDVGFIVRAVENFVEFVPKEKELGSVLIDITSAVMHLPKPLLLAAEETERACSRLVSAVESLPSTLQAHPSSLAMDAYKITRDSFIGITCVWYSWEVAGRFFQCNTISNRTASLATKQKVLESSVQVPKRLFYQLELQGSHTTSHQLLIVMYETAALFPRRSTADGKDVTGSVVGIKLVDMEVSGLLDPVEIIVRPPPGAQNAAPPTPVWWDDALGDWRPDGCTLGPPLGELLVFHCNRFGYFGLLENTSPALVKSPTSVSINLVAGTPGFHPVIYAGTFIGVTCLLTAALSYVTNFPHISLGVKLKHALIHTWLCLSAFTLLFALGAKQTASVRLCEWIGVSLHYLALCALCWMAVTVKVMYKRLPRPPKLSSSSSDDLPPEVPLPPHRPPLLGVYMVGYGIAFLICGLSSAANMRGYAGPAYCFLRPGPALSALLIPAALLLGYVSVMALLLRCAAASHDSNAQLSDGTQATDLELMEGGGGGATEATSLHSALTPSSQLEDPEHPPLTHLRAFLLVLLISLLLAVSGALCTMPPRPRPPEELLFSLLYSVFCVLLGAFVLFFYCFARTDVRAGWFKAKSLYRSRSVIHSSHGPRPLVSTSQSLSSSNALKSMAADLNRTASPGGKSDTALGLVVLKRPQPGETPQIVNNFYNPQQSTAARKFFKKQRRKQHNTLRPLRPAASDTLSSSMCGHKVNNTNLHVDLPAGDKQLRRFLAAEQPHSPDKPLHNNDGTLRDGGLRPKCNNSEYSEEFVTSQVSESGGEGEGEREECSCAVSEPQSLGTDCGRNISCGSSHAAAVSDSDRSSHLYATVAPEVADSSLERHRSQEERRRKNYSLAPSRRRRERGKEEEKKETCL